MSKTLVFCQILKGVVERNKKAIIVVRGRHLVSQASDRLHREGVPHGVIMSNHWNDNPNAHVFVCSIDTLRARKVRPEASIIIIDECHHAVSQSYRDLVSLYPEAYFLSVTATPYPNEGLEHIATEVVMPITMGELIAQGYLVSPIYYAPTAPDMRGVKTSKGDYATGDVENIMLDPALHITGDIVKHWVKIGEGRPTICFATTVKHSRYIVDNFKLAGIPAEHIEAETPDEERRDAIARLVNGETKIISNVGILCTGVDIPEVSCLIMARPTKSYMLYVQQAGRGTRPAPGKKDFIILDHAGNVLRHNYITIEREAVLKPLDKKSRNQKDGAETIKSCQECYAIYDSSLPECPSCGFVNKAKPRSLKENDGELERLDPAAFKIKIDRRHLVQKDFYEFMDIVKDRNYNPWWCYHRLKEKYSAAEADKYKLKILRASKARS